MSLLLITSAKATPLLSDTQIIQQVERLYSGKVISVRKPNGLKTVQVNILMHNADILRLTIDPVTGKTISRTKEIDFLKKKPQ